MTQTADTLEIPCPACADFTLVDEQQYVCTKCGYTTRKMTLKTALEYADYVYQFGHRYRTAFEEQLKEHGQITPLDTLPEAPPLYTYITLALLSSTVGQSAWFLSKAAAEKLVLTYNEKFQSDISVSLDELRQMYRNVREFTNNFAEVDSKVRNGVFEAIFAHECSKKDAEKLLKMRIRAQKAKGAQKQELESKADRFLEEMMRSTFKKVGKKVKPTPEEVGGYWHNLFD